MLNIKRLDIDEAMILIEGARAAAARKATHEFNASNVPGNLDFGIHTEVVAGLSSVGGGLPVTVTGDVVGGIGLSSGTPAQDMQCAQAGIDH